MKNRLFIAIILVLQTVSLYATEEIATSYNNLRDKDPDLIRTAMPYRWGSPWGGILDALHGNNIRINPASSPTRTYMTKLYDGQIGTFNNWPGEYCIFDGQDAVIDITIPKGQSINSISFSVIEIEDKPKSVAFASYNNSRLELSRKVVDRKGKALVVNYFNDHISLEEGILTLHYKSNYIQSVFMDEIVINNLGIKPSDFYINNRVKVDTSVSVNATINTIELWKANSRTNQCENLPKNFSELGIKRRIKELLGKPEQVMASNLVYHSTVKFDDITFYPFVLQVDRTGERFIDTVRAWLIVPNNIKGKLPLAVLNHQGHIYAGTENIGFLGEQSIAFVGDLAKLGVASLVIEAYQHANANSNKSDLFEFHPRWSMTGKDLDNIERGLDFVLSKRFEKLTGVAIDKEKIANWGFSFGSWNSLLSGLLDDRYKTVTFSSFHYRSKDIVRGFSTALYMPLLACFENSQTLPISMPELMNSYGQKHVMAVAPDVELSEAWREKVGSKNNINIVAHPYGHLVTETEKKSLINFILKSFNIDKQLVSTGPKHDLITSRDGMKEYLKRDADWREKILRAFTETDSVPSVDAKEEIIKQDLSWKDKILKIFSKWSN